MQRFLLLAAVLASYPAFGSESNILPDTGFWNIVDEPGTGISVDVQNGILVATIQAYREDGAAYWLLATGRIMGGELEARLLEFSDGACLGCAFREPFLVSDMPTVHFEFLGTNLGFMTVGNSRQAIRRLNFGYGVPWLEVSGFGTGFPPDLTGRWLFTGGRTEEFEPIEVNFNHCVSLDPPWTRYGLVRYIARSQDQFGVLTCLRGRNGDRATNELFSCTLELNNEPVWSAYIGDIGVDRITAYAGEPLPREASDRRGETTILGFRLSAQADPCF